MFLSKKHLNILDGYITGDLDFEGICYILKLNPAQIDTLLNDKESMKMLFDNYNIYIDLFNNIGDIPFNEENTLKCIEAIYKHGLEKSPYISERLEDFTDRFMEYYRDETSDILKTKFQKYANDIPCLQSLID